MGTYDITLRPRAVPVFPPICVVCAKQDPGTTMQISILGSNATSAAENAVDIALEVGVGSPASRNTRTNIKGIPVCPGCEGRLKWYHRVFKIVTYTAWIPGLLLMLIVPGPTWVKIAIFILVIVAPPILSMIFPPPFGATIVGGKVNFEFRSEPLADEFRRLNEHAAA
jgi:hypothetical protein